MKRMQNTASLFDHMDGFDFEKYRLLRYFEDKSLSNIHDAAYVVSIHPVNRRWLEINYRPVYQGGLHEEIEGNCPSPTEAVSNMVLFPSLADIVTHAVYAAPELLKNEAPENKATLIVDLEYPEALARYLHEEEKAKISFKFSVGHEPSKGKVKQMRALLERFATSGQEFMEKACAPLDDNLALEWWKAGPVKQGHKQAELNGLFYNS